MEIVIILIVLSLLAWLGHEMAKTRNRNPKLWAVLCFAFGLIAVVVLALIGKSSKS